MSALTDADLTALAAECGVSVEAARRMYASTRVRDAVALDTSEVTRWTTCAECKHRASVSVALDGGWTCDECGATFTDHFVFSNAEKARLAAVEEACS